MANQSSSDRAAVLIVFFALVAMFTAAWALASIQWGITLDYRGTIIAGVVSASACVAALYAAVRHDFLFGTGSVTESDDGGDGDDRSPESDDGGDSLGQHDAGTHKSIGGELSGESGSTSETDDLFALDDDGDGDPWRADTESEAAGGTRSTGSEDSSASRSSSVAETDSEARSAAADSGEQGSGHREHAPAESAASGATEDTHGTIDELEPDNEDLSLATELDERDYTRYGDRRPR